MAISLSGIILLHFSSTGVFQAMLETMEADILIQNKTILVAVAASPAGAGIV